MKVGLFSLGSLSLVILLDSPASALKLDIVRSSVLVERLQKVQGANGAKDRFERPEYGPEFVSNELEWDPNADYPVNILFRWSITAKN